MASHSTTCGSAIILRIVAMRLDALVSAGTIALAFQTQPPTNQIACAGDAALDATRPVERTILDAALQEILQHD